MVMDVTDQSCHPQQVSPLTELAPGHPAGVDNVTDRCKPNRPTPGTDPPTPVGFLATEEVPRIEWSDVVDYLSARGEVAPRDHVDVTLAVSKPMRHTLSPQGARPPQPRQPRETEEGVQN
jgi:hypothetical protein